MTAKVTASRNPSVEVFRCLLMFFIVLYHCCMFCIWEETFQSWMLPFYALLIWHVDGFVAISGWFGIKFSWRKFFRIWGLVAFYSMLSIGYLLVMRRPVTFRTCSIYGGWFTATYLGLMLVSPLLNAALESLTKDIRKLWFCLGTFGIMMFLNWVPTHFYSAVAPCGVGGSTLVNFMFVYVLVRAIRLTELQFSRKRLLKLGGGGGSTNGDLVRYDGIVRAFPFA